MFIPVITLNKFKTCVGGLEGKKTGREAVRLRASELATCSYQEKWFHRENVPNSASHLYFPIAMKIKRLVYRYLIYSHNYISADFMNK